MQRDNEHAPDVDILMSGAPCPPFSSAGKGKGMADPRGWLLLSSVKYAIVKRPPVWVRECQGLGKSWQQVDIEKNPANTEVGRVQVLLRNDGYQGTWCSTKPPQNLLDCLVGEALAPWSPFQLPWADPSTTTEKVPGEYCEFWKKAKLSKGPLANVRRAILAVEIV